MTAPDTPPPPPGPGRDTEELADWAETLAAAAPPLSDGQQTTVRRLLGGHATADRERSVRAA